MPIEISFLNDSQSGYKQVLTFFYVKGLYAYFYVKRLYAYFY